jgi:2-methylisocitrate lyase-like PEP mutase family enzyme
MPMMMSRKRPSPPRSEKELEEIGKSFKGTPQMTNMFEVDDETPWLTPRELHSLGFSMILYPTSVLFQLVATIQRALDQLKKWQSDVKERGGRTQRV